MTHNVYIRTSTSESTIKYIHASVVEWIRNEQFHFLSGLRANASRLVVVSICDSLGEQTKGGSAVERPPKPKRSHITP